jgi:hypothetical protein
MRPVTELKGLKNDPSTLFQMAESTGHAHAMSRASAEPVRMREHERVFQSHHNQRPHRHAPYVFAVFSMLSILPMDNQSVDETFGQIYTIARIFSIFSATKGRVG